MKPFQKALLTGLAAITATVSVSNAQDALGTINKVQVTATYEVPSGTGDNNDPTVVTGPSGASTERRLPKLARITTKSILEALRDTPDSGFPIDSGLTGWTLVEIFTQGDEETPGVSQGIFATKKDFTPIPVPEAVLSVAIAAYADSLETYSTSFGRDGQITKNDHIFKGLSTGALTSPSSVGLGVGFPLTFNGFTVSRTGIRLVGPRNINPSGPQSPSTTPLSIHTITSRTTTLSGAGGSTSDGGSYALYGTIISNGAANLTSIQAYLNAAAAGATAE